MASISDMDKKEFPDCPIGPLMMDIEITPYLACNLFWMILR